MSVNSPTHTTVLPSDRTMYLGAHIQRKKSMQSRIPSVAQKVCRWRTTSMTSKVCLAERITSNTDTLPRYGGIYTCQYGKLATRLRRKGCEEGYSAHAIGTIDGNCFLEVCLKFEKPDDRGGLPNVALPPFLQIDTVYFIVDGKETMSNSV